MAYLLDTNAVIALMSQEQNGDKSLTAFNWNSI